MLVPCESQSESPERLSRAVLGELNRSSIVSMANLSSARGSTGSGSACVFMERRGRKFVVDCRVLEDTLL